MLNSCKMLNLSLISIAGLTCTVTTTVHADVVPSYTAMPTVASTITTSDLVARSGSFPGVKTYWTITPPEDSNTNNVDPGIETKGLTTKLDLGIDAKCSTYKIDPGIECIQPTAITKPQGVLSPDTLDLLPQLKGGSELPQDLPVPGTGQK
jgi:hypothetical protein